MKILFMAWKSLGQKDLADEFVRRGWEVVHYSFPREKENTRINQKLCEEIVRTIAGNKYDFVFSFNYFPADSPQPFIKSVFFLPISRTYKGNLCPV